MVFRCTIPFFGVQHDITKGTPKKRNEKMIKTYLLSKEYEPAYSFKVIALAKSDGTKFVDLFSHSIIPINAMSNKKKAGERGRKRMRDP